MLIYIIILFHHLVSLALKSPIGRVVNLDIYVLFLYLINALNGQLCSNWHNPSGRTVRIKHS